MYNSDYIGVYVVHDRIKILLKAMLTENGIHVINVNSITVLYQDILISLNCTYFVHHTARILFIDVQYIVILTSLSINYSYTFNIFY